MKQRDFYKKYSCKLNIAVLCFLFFLLLSQAAFAQDFTSIDSDLQTLENLINDTIANTEEQQRLLDDLRNSLIESGSLITSYENIITEQEILLLSLRVQLNEMSETYRMQSALSVKYAQSSRFWRTFSIIAIPVTAIISGGIVWLILN